MKIFYLLFFISFKTFCQFKPINKVGSPECIDCSKLIQDKPKEVLFGIEIENNSEVFFVINDASWFENNWTNPNFKLAVELIAKSNFDCKKPIISKSKWLEPLTYPELKKRKKTNKNRLKILLGNVPKELKSEELEGNLAILVSGKMCFYNTFLNIESAKWELLPMGFYGNEIFQKFEKKIVQPSIQTIEIALPFQKNNAHLEEKFQEEIGIICQKYKAETIKKIEIKANASVEGSLKDNSVLFNNRADFVKKIINQKLNQSVEYQLNNNENWNDFYVDILNTKHSYLANEDKENVKIKLQNKKIQADLEPILKNHRTTNVVFYFDSPKQKFNDFLEEWKNAIINNDTQKGAIIQEEIYLNCPSPDQYLNKIEIPDKRIFANLLNNELVFKIGLGLENEESALKKFQTLLKKDPQNSRFNYNMVVLKIMQFTINKPIDEVVLLKEINNLDKLGISKNLVQRILVNYHQILAEKMLKDKKYEAKDKSIYEIKKIYNNLIMNDLEALSLSKMLSSFNLESESKSVLKPFVFKTKSEDLLFYYLTILMVSNENISSEISDIARRAVDINNEKFCNLFNPISENGVSFQLLTNAKLRGIYCEKCIKNR